MQQFTDDVERLSQHLCRAYPLTFEIDRERVLLKNDILAVRFYPGDVRDSFVSASIQDTAKRYISYPMDLRLYADYLSVDAVYFPTAVNQAKPHPFRYHGSPIQIVEYVVFLGSHCGELLAGSTTALEKIAKLYKQKQMEYNARMTGG
jgi:hypothetical protein